MVFLLKILLFSNQPVDYSEDLESLEECKPIVGDFYMEYLEQGKHAVTYCVKRDNNNSIYIINRDDSSGEKIDIIQKSDVNCIMSCLGNITKVMGRNPNYISVEENEVVFWEDMYGEQIIYSIDGSKPENKISSNNEDIYFVQYDEHWYAYQLR